MVEISQSIVNSQSSKNYLVNKNNKGKIDTKKF